MSLSALHVGGKGQKPSAAYTFVAMAWRRSRKSDSGQQGDDGVRCSHVASGFENQRMDGQFAGRVCILSSNLEALGSDGVCICPQEPEIGSSYAHH